MHAHLSRSKSGEMAGKVLMFAWSSSTRQNSRQKEKQYWNIVSRSKNKGTARRPDQQATARSRLTALHPKLKVEDFDRTSDELERELSRLDVECGIDKHIRDGELSFFCHTAVEFAEKAQKYGASAELENEDAVVLWPITKEMQ